MVESATGYSALAGGIIFNQAIRQGGHANDPVKRHPHIPYVVLGTALLWYDTTTIGQAIALPLHCQ